MAHPMIPSEVVCVQHFGIKKSKFSEVSVFYLEERDSFGPAGFFQLNFSALHLLAGMGGEGNMSIKCTFLFKDQKWQCHHQEL